MAHKLKYSSNEFLSQTKEISKSRGTVDGFTPGVKYLIRACPVDGNNVRGAFTNYFEIRAN